MLLFSKENRCLPYVVSIINTGFATASLPDIFILLVNLAYIDLINSLKVTVQKPLTN